MTDLEIEVRPDSPAAPGAFSLYLDSVKVGSMFITDEEITEMFVCDTVIAVRRPAIDDALLKKHRRFWEASPPGSHQPERSGFPPGWKYMGDRDDNK